MYLSIIFFPLLGSLSCGLLGRWLGKKGANFVSLFCISLCLMFCALAFFEVGFAGSFCLLNVGNWINCGQIKIYWSFLFDSLTVTMLLVVTFVSLLVHIYSTTYMNEDPHCPRFMSYLSVFTFFMIFLVCSNNVVQMFLGWEGVGLASYLLINFWYSRLSANQSAVKALIVNRVGDFGLFISILIIFYTFQSVDYSVIFPFVPLITQSNFLFFNYELNSLFLIGIFLCIGAFGKSAQLGLHSWLPDAMEGPTPVSALIHAATMVTAGVFLIIRFSPLIEYIPMILFFLVLIGSITAFFAATAGLFQNDIKKIIAYSTCSQLGYMVFACGLSYYQVSIFHLVNHAFFKALLFLSAGSVIHALNDEQDIRRMGSLRHFLPLTYSMIIIGSLALVGFPFLSGFYSKDLILELSQLSYYLNINKSYSIFAYWLGVISVFFTAFYSFRLVFFVFLNTSNVSRTYFGNLHESDIKIIFPLLLLAIGSIFVGFLGKDLFVGLGTSFWKTSIFSLPKQYNFFEAEFSSVLDKWLPFLFTSFGFLVASSINIFITNYKHVFPPHTYSKFILTTLNKKWYFDNFFNKIIVNSLLHFSYHSSFKNLDKGFIELLGPYGVSNLIIITAKNWSWLQTGQVTHYVFFILIGLLISFLIGLSNVVYLICNDSYLPILSFLYLSVFYPNTKIFN